MSINSLLLLSTVMLMVLYLLILVRSYVNLKSKKLCVQATLSLSIKITPPDFFYQNLQLFNNGLQIIGAEAKGFSMTDEIETDYVGTNEKADRRTRAEKFS